MNARQLPNAITLARIALVLPLGMLIRSGDYGWALTVAAVAALSDALDGFLARRFGWQSALGGMLDPLADKLLLAACFIGLWSAGEISGWLLLLVLGRDLLIIAGALAYRALIGPVSADPTWLGKLNTAVQIGFVLLLLLHLGVTPLPTTLLQALTVAVTAVTALSGLDYVWRWSRRAIRAGSIRSRAGSRE